MERAGFLHCIVDQHTVASDPPLPEERPSITTGNSGRPSAKRYHRSKLLAGIIHALLGFVFTLAVVAGGISLFMEETVRQWIANDYAVLLGFAAVFGILQATVTLPVRFFSSYVLEHRYRLSNQTVGAWLWEKVKGMLVGIPLTVPLLLAFYYCIRSYGSFWWLPLGVVLFFFSVIVARLAPVLIFPLFYKFKPLEDGVLRDRIVALCRQAGMKVSGVFVFNMSKNTKKANAAFAGIGTSKRIILGDTLVANFTDEEIETVFAHELGHFKLGHIWRSMFVGTVSTFLGLYGTSLLYEASLPWFGFASVDAIAALPLLGLWLGVYSLVTTPLGNMLSRAHERAADRYAVRMTGKKGEFVNALIKLSRVNLADRSPHPLVEFFFHSHPSIDKRVRAVEAM